VHHTAGGSGAATISGADSVLAVGAYVDYQGFSGCTVAAVYSDGTYYCYGIDIPGVTGDTPRRVRAADVVGANGLRAAGAAGSGSGSVSGSGRAWSCTHCTLETPPGRRRCDACDLPAPGSSNSRGYGGGGYNDGGRGGGDRGGGSAFIARSARAPEGMDQELYDMLRGMQVGAN
jgi:hypothetical protein